MLYPIKKGHDTSCFAWAVRRRRSKSVLRKTHRALPLDAGGAAETFLWPSQETKWLYWHGQQRRWANPLGRGALARVTWLEKNCPRHQHLHLAAQEISSPPNPVRRTFSGSDFCPPPRSPAMCSSRLLYNLSIQTSRLRPVHSPEGQ